MKFKILKGTDLFAQLEALRANMKACDAAAKALADAHGAIGYAGGRGVGGGLRALCFAEKPQGFKLLQYPNYYYPKVLKANRPLLEAIAALPEVKNEALGGLLGFRHQTVVEGDHMYWCSRPAVVWGQDFHLVDYGRGKGEPAPDMVEILESEYLALQGK